MGDYGKRIRLRRILNPVRGTLVVAFDHALVHGPIPGTADPAGQIRRFAEAQADAVLINFGAIAHFAQALSAPSVPGLITRLDWTTALGTPTIPQGRFQTCLVAHPEDALRSGADAVITFLIIGTGDAEFEKNEIERVGQLARECEGVGMPLVVESLARGSQVQNPCDPQWLLLHSRIAAELGADVIKMEYAGDAAAMRGIVEACPVPVLVLGGSRAGSDQEVLHTVRGIMTAGAAGVFFGRNVFQADDMLTFLQSVRTILEDRKSPQG